MILTHDLCIRSLLSSKTSIPIDATMLRQLLCLYMHERMNMCHSGFNFWLLACC